MLNIHSSTSKNTVGKSKHVAAIFFGNILRMKWHIRSLVTTLVKRSVRCSVIAGEVMVYSLHYQRSMVDGGNPVVLASNEACGLLRGLENRGREPERERGLRSM